MRTPFLALALLTTAPAFAQSSPDLSSLVADTYGDASGAVPMRGLGLVLELVGAGSDSPTLRLFGGVPGQPATIRVGLTEQDAPGPQGSRRLVGDLVASVQGAFDWRGFYEVPLASITTQPGELFAQGAHAGLLGLAPGGRPLLQFSNGLRLAPAEEVELTLEELLPSLPTTPDTLPWDATLAERLQRYLNSTGDAVSIELHVEGNGGAGACIGGAGELAFAIERTAEGSYELTLAADAAVTVGVELAEGCEAAAQGGYGVTQVFTFHSAPGVARGLFGIVAALQSGGATPMKDLQDTDLLPDAGVQVERLRAAIAFAQDNADAAEALLHDGLDAGFELARSRHATAVARVRIARANLASASWHQRPARAARLAVAAGRAAVTRAALEVARTAREQVVAAVDRAQALVEQHREELRAVLADLARAGRVASALVQIRGYIAQHFTGTEVRRTGAASVELGVPLPVEIPGLGAGIEGEVEVETSILFASSDHEDVQHIVVTQSVQGTGTASAAALVGAELERSHTASLETDITIGPEGVSRSTSASLTSDLQGKVFAGRLVAVGTGVGRQRTLELSAESTPGEGIDLGMLLQKQDLGDATVGIEVMDRRVHTVDCGLIVSLAGNGGGFELAIEWADQGPVRTRSTTIRDAVTSIVDGARQVPDLVGALAN